MCDDLCMVPFCQSRRYLAFLERAETMNKSAVEGIRCCDLSGRECFVSLCRVHFSLWMVVTGTDIYEHRIWRKGVDGDYGWFPNPRCVLDAAETLRWRLGGVRSVTKE